MASADDNGIITPSRDSYKWCWWLHNQRLLLIDLWLLTKHLVPRCWYYTDGNIVNW